MAIPTDVQTLSIEEILGDGEPGKSAGMKLRIPEYQRPYEWSPELALRLFDDLAFAVGPTGETGATTWEDVHARALKGTDQRPKYLIGSLILHATERTDTPHVHDIVDGQQRLLTLLMLRQELTPPTIRESSPEAGEELPPARQVQDALRARLQDHDDAERLRCWEVISQRAQMVVIPTDDLDEAFNIFDSQNTRGRGLAPHDLLKAHHLREMRTASEATRIAAVEKWEETDQEDLRRLFARYLYRIARWSQGLPARSFTAHDIGFFKGIPATPHRTPRQQYHVAAQAMIPAFHEWEPPARGTDSESQRRRMNHARFRLDEPVMAGSPFFEMVDFFLAELRRLRDDEHVVCSTRPDHADRRKPSRAEPDPGSWEDLFGTRSSAGDELTMRPGRSTMFYVSELYLAATLYAVNCFGESAVKSATPLLRRWAFRPRTTHHAVREASIDLHSTRDDSVFPLMRRSQELESLLRHQAPLPDDPELPAIGRETGTLLLLEAGFSPSTVYPDHDGTP